MTVAIGSQWPRVARLQVFVPRLVAIALLTVLAALMSTRAEAMGNTSTILRANPAPATYGQTVTLTATVNGGVNGAFAGTVTFKDGTNTLGTVPTISVAPAAAFSISEDHACGVDMAGDVANHTDRITTSCWGDNTYGQIGDGSTTFRATPTFANDLNGIFDVAAGLRFTCALLTINNGVACWGDNSHNQLGEGSSNPIESAPVQVTGASSGIVAIASGGFHSCAISANIADTSGGGTVRCWGDNAYGQLGNTTPNTTSAAVVTVSGISTAIAIATGYQHSCALLSDGTVKCWGHNGFGQIGSGAPVDGQVHATPVTVPGITNATAIASTKNHTCVALLDGTAKCWGANDRKQLGDGNGGGASDKSATPVTVLNVSDAVTVAAGYAHSCVVRSSGVASCWGDNQFGQLGNSSSSASPQTIVDVTGLTAASLRAGGQSTCAVNQSGTLQCWGYSVGGQPSQNVPVNTGVNGAAGYAVLAQARLLVSSLKADTHSITAEFATTTSGIQPSTSNTVSLFVQGLASTTTVTANQNPSHLGDDVTFTVSVTGANGPAGTGFAVATLKVDGNSVDFQNIVSGSATLTATGLSIGTHTVQAFFSGDDVYAPSQTAIVDQVVKGATTVALVAGPALTGAGQSVGLTATVSVTPPAVETPTGSVTFKEGTKTIGTGPLNGSGVASASTSSLGVGSHNITAIYGGDDNLFNSTSNSASVTISAMTGVQKAVNTQTAGAQKSPAVAAITNGHVAVWVSNGQDGAGYGIYGQRFATNGNPAGVEFRVNTTTAGAQLAPRVAGLKAGGFVVVWQSTGDKSGQGVFGQRYAASGKALGAQFVVNTTTAGNQAAPAIAALLDGGFVVAWASAAQDGSGLGIYAQRYTAAGAKVGVETSVNKTKPGDQSAPSVAGLTGGGFVIAWQGPDASGTGVYAQRFAPNGAKSGGELAVNTVTAQDQSMPTVAGLGNGGFVIAWQSFQQDGSGLGIYAQRYNATGVRQSNNKLVNTTKTDDQKGPVAAGFTDSGYAIVWTSKLQDGSAEGIYAQVFEDDGTLRNVEFRVNTTTAGNQNEPALAAFAQGKFVAVWTSADAGQTGIYFQRLTIPPPPG